MDRPPATAERLVANLVDEGLVIRQNGELLLP